TAELFQAFIAIHNEGSDIEPETLMNHIGDDEMSLDLAGELLKSPPRRNAGDIIDNVLHEAESCVFTLRGMAITNRITELSREASLAQQSGDGDRVNTLVLEQLELERIRRE